MGAGARGHWACPGELPKGSVLSRGAGAPVTPLLLSFPAHLLYAGGSTCHLLDCSQPGGEVRLSCPFHRGGTVELRGPET